MNIRQEAKKTEAKLDFFNRQDPACQTELIASGYFRKEDESSSTNNNRAAVFAFAQLSIPTPG